MANYIERPTISHDAALNIFQIAVKEGEKLGVSVSVAVVDTGLNLVGFLKTDNATAHSAETSRCKANTAASTKRPTGWMRDGLETTLPSASGNLLTNIPGGFPLKFEGKYVGGLGVAGGTVEQDEAIARAVIEAIGAEVND